MGMNASGISGATVSIADGPNAGKSATTSSSGSYSFTGLQSSGFTVNAAATNYSPSSKGVTLTSNSTLNFNLQSVPLFSMSGVGNTVFNMPTTVSRIHIVGTYTGNCCSNFIVHIGGQVIVNDQIGPAYGRNVSDGIYLTTGGVVEITNSDGVVWSFTEVRL